MTLFHRSNPRTPAEVLEADRLAIVVEPEPAPHEGYIDSFTRHQLVLVNGNWRQYGGVLVEADADLGQMLVRWYDPESRGWRTNWWDVARIEHMAYGLSLDEQREIARALLDTGRLPKRESAPAGALR